MDRSKGITSSIPCDIEDILIDIKFISHLPPSSKYDLERRRYVDAANIFTRVYRSLFTNERRMDAFSFINDTITRAVDVMKRKTQWAEIIIQETAKIDQAVSNLKHVYSDHPEAVARLETIQLRIQPSTLHRSITETC